MASGCLAERAPQEGALSRNAKVRKILFTQSLFSFFFSIFRHLRNRTNSSTTIYQLGSTNHSHTLLRFINLINFFFTFCSLAPNCLCAQHCLFQPRNGASLTSAQSLPQFLLRSAPPDHNTMLLPSTRTGTHDEPFSSFLITS